VYTVASTCKRLHGRYMTLKAFIATFAHLHKISRVWIDRVPVDVKRCLTTTLRSRWDREQFLETGNGLLWRRRNDSDHAKCGGVCRHSTPSSVFAWCLRDRALFDDFSKSPNVIFPVVGNSAKTKIANNSGRGSRKFLKISHVIGGHYPYRMVPPYCHAHFRFRR